MQINKLVARLRQGPPSFGSSWNLHQVTEPGIRPALNSAATEWPTERMGNGRPVLNVGPFFFLGDPNTLFTTPLKGSPPLHPCLCRHLTHPGCGTHMPRPHLGVFCSDTPHKGDRDCISAPLADSLDSDSFILLVTSSSIFCFFVFCYLQRERGFE